MDFLLFILTDDTENIEKIEKMFTRICGVDIEDNVLKAIECLKKDSYTPERFDDLIIYFRTKKEKREIESIMFDSNNNNKKRGRL